MNLEIYVIIQILNMSIIDMMEDEIVMVEVQTQVVGLTAQIVVNIGIGQKQEFLN